MIFENKPLKSVPGKYEQKVSDIVICVLLRVLFYISNKVMLEQA